MSYSQKVAILIIQFYKYAISPFLPGGCRYLPTCSQYAKEAVIKYGAIKGIKFGIKRICKCHPWGGEWL